MDAVPVLRFTSVIAGILMKRSRRSKRCTKITSGRNTSDMSKPYTHVTLPQCRPDGPFEFIERIRLPDGKTRIRARCKRCGNVFIRSRTFFYNSRNQSCGCAHHAQRNEAIREKISESQRSIPHKCSICGAEFQGGTNVKYCPKCRKAARTTYMRNFERRKLGWTEEEIRLGHRLTTKP